MLTYACFFTLFLYDTFNIIYTYRYILLFLTYLGLLFHTLLIIFFFIKAMSEAHDTVLEGKALKESVEPVAQI